MQYTDLKQLLLLLLDLGIIFTLSLQLFIAQTVLLTEPSDLKLLLGGSTRATTAALGRRGQPLRCSDLPRVDHSIKEREPSSVITEGLRHMLM